MKEWHMLISLKKEQALLEVGEEIFKMNKSF